MADKKEEKNIDGIQKYDSEDLRKAREIVLSSIGEKDAKKSQVKDREMSKKDLEKIEEKTAQISKQDAKKGKNLDGLLVNSNIKPSIKSINNKTSQDKTEEEKSIPKEKQQARSDIIDKNQKDEEDKVALKNEGEKENKVKDKKELNPKEVDYSVKKQSGKSKKEEKKQIIQDKINKKTSRKEKKKLLNNKQKSKGGNFYLTCRFFYHALLVLLIILILFYAVFLALIFIFKIDNQATRTIAKYLPAPALISKAGMVDYYKYKDAEKELINYYLGHTEEMPGQEIITEQIKAKLIKEIVVNNLANQYNIDLSSFEQGIKQLEAKMAVDKEINYSMLVRAGKIREMLAAGGQFYQIARRYSDDFNLGAYYSEEEAKKIFGQEIINLEANQLSNVIMTSQGYYIVECTSKNNNLIGLRYVLLKPKSIDDYAREIMLDLKVRSLVG